MCNLFSSSQKAVFNPNGYTISMALIAVARVTLLLLFMYFMIYFQSKYSRHHRIFSSYLIRLSIVSSVSNNYPKAFRPLYLNLFSNSSNVYSLNAQFLIKSLCIRFAINRESSTASAIVFHPLLDPRHCGF